MLVQVVGITTPTIEGIESANDLIAYVARVSNPNNQKNTETAPKLVKYLINNDHWSPFEMVSVTMEIVTTRDIARQILRHRSFSFQEFSQRYAVANEFVKREARLQDKKNRQNSIPLGIEDKDLREKFNMRQAKSIDRAKEDYQWALDQGIAKEQARAFLPEGLTVSTLYMAGTLRSWIHYIDLRSSNGTQLEHQNIAKACRDLIISHFPVLEEHLLRNER